MQSAGVFFIGPVEAQARRKRKRSILSVFCSVNSLFVVMNVRPCIGRPGDEAPQLDGSLQLCAISRIALAGAWAPAHVIEV